MAKSAALGFCLLCLLFVSESGEGHHLRPPPPRERFDCDSYPCGDGYVCVDYPSRKCLPLKGQKEEQGLECGHQICPPNSICRWERVDCVRAPCSRPEPTCVPRRTKRETCGVITCEIDETCEHGVTCLGIGCPPSVAPRCVQKKR